MQHYSQEDWTDFARNVAAKGKKAEMQSHLDTGCKPCNKAYGIWQRVSQAAQREAAYEPPQAAVQTVKGMGVIHGLGKAPKKSLSLVQLLFDSFQSPIQAGVRSSAATARQLLYGAGNFRIDLRMEPQADSEKVALVGQVLECRRSVPVDHTNPRRAVQGNQNPVRFAHQMPSANSTSNANSTPTSSSTSGSPVRWKSGFRW